MSDLMLLAFAIPAVGLVALVAHGVWSAIRKRRRRARGSDHERQLVRSAAVAELRRRRR